MHTLSSAAVLGIFVKEPRAGQVKTRLAAKTSSDWAARCAHAFLEDWLAKLVKLHVHRVIAHAPASASDYFSRWMGSDYKLIAQSDGDLGERLASFFSHHREQSYSHIVVVGADSPTLPLEFIEQAFQSLHTNDVVIGPSLDGGYYLIGSGSNDLPIFDDIPWSTSKVLEMTVQRVRSAKARLAVLPPWYDVDTVEDWSLLRGHVLAMRQAGIDPEVPNIERLIHEQTQGGIV